jgi:glycosyltransferase involved in cell wall biosynthesis
MTPRIAVIIPARDEAAHLGACLRSIAAQRLPELEVIVIDDGSTDATGDLARAAGATVLATGGVGPSRGRNLGVAATTAELCFFTDADCELAPGCVATLAEALAAGGPTVASAGGRQLAPVDDPPYAQRVQRFLEAVGFVSEYARPDGAPQPARHNPSCVALVRRAALLGVGGFRDELWPCEDLDLDLKLRAAGFTLRYVPAACVHHHRPASPAAFRRMMRGYGRGHAALVKLHGPTRLMHLLPLVALGTGGLAPAAAVATAPLWLALRGQPPRAIPGLTAMLASALVEWHRGFVEGLRGRSAIAPPARRP